MMKTSIAFVAVLALVGCKKDGGSSAAAGGGGGGGDCAVSIGKGVDKMAAARSGGKDLTPEIKAKMDEFTGKMKDVIVKRCTDDKWPAEVIACFETVSSRPDMMKCQGMLPQDQQDRVRAEVRDLMMSSGGIGRINRHGSGGGGDMMQGHPDMGGGSGGSGGGATITQGSAATGRWLGGTGSRATAAGSGSAK